MNVEGRPPHPHTEILLDLIAELREWAGWHRAMDLLADRVEGRLREQQLRDENPTATDEEVIERLEDTQ